MMEDKKCKEEHFLREQQIPDNKLSETVNLGKHKYIQTGDIDKRVDVT